MPTISFFAGFEIRDEEKGIKVLEALKEPGSPVSLTPEERELLRKQEEAGKASLDRLEDLLKEL
jgi:hypothetical protein